MKLKENNVLILQSGLIGVVQKRWNAGWVGVGGPQWVSNQPTRNIAEELEQPLGPWKGKPGVGQRDHWADQATARRWAQLGLVGDSWEERREGAWVGSSVDQHVSSISLMVSGLVSLSLGWSRERHAGGALPSRSPGSLYLIIRVALPYCLCQNPEQPGWAGEL